MSRARFRADRVLATEPTGQIVRLDDPPEAARLVARALTRPDRITHLSGPFRKNGLMVTWHIVTDEVRRRVCAGAGAAATVPVDGTVTATWSIRRTNDTAVLEVQPLRPLVTADRAPILHMV